MNPERRGLVLVIVVLGISAVLGGIYGPSVKATTSSTDDYQASVRDFTKILDVVQNNYAETVDVDKAVYQGAIPGMLRMLDPHSNFFDSRQFALLREDQRGKYYGVGMVIAPRENHTVVVAPYVGAPAYNAGLRPGDMIIKVDDKPADGLTTTEVADMLKGPKGTVVKIVVSREGYADQLTFTVTRDEIPRHSVDIAFLMKPGIGYVKLSQFNETTDREIGEALKQLNANTLDGLILDMRGNPGGLLNEAVAVGDMFLEKNQLIVSYHGRNAPERRFYAIRGNQGMNVPLVILVNNNSASAAEIVTGAVQDHDRGLVVGETTFGKGLVQTVTPLAENTGLALTTARYYTPSGRLIQRDYNGISLYDYYYNNRDNDSGASNSPPGREIKMTDSGRTVYGGGGINPDIKIPAIKTNNFEDQLLQKYAFFNFAKHYVVNHKVTKQFEVDEQVMQEFRRFLDEQKIPFTEAELAENSDWLRSNIKTELFINEFGQQEGMKVHTQNDPAVTKALELLPKAKELADNAKKTIAARNNARLTATQQESAPASANR